MKTKDEIDEALARHFAGESLSGKQQALLKEWIANHEDEYNRLSSLMAEISEHGKSPDFNAGFAWQKVAPCLKERHSYSSFHGKGKAVYCGIAAAVVILLTIGTIFLTHSSDNDVIRYANLTDETKRITLPDSSVTLLYPSAYIEYSEDGLRKVELEGKAFFHVRKNGKRFTVSARHLAVEVLGTSFLVDAMQPEQTDVFVETGRVMVTAKKDNAIINAGEKAVSEGKSVITSEIENPQEFFGIKKGVAFKDAPVNEILKQIEASTGIKIETGAGFEAKKITTRIDLDKIWGIAEEIAFICGSRCDTLEVGQHYRLYYE